MVVNELIPQLKSFVLESADGLPSGKQILADINQFVRGNPIVSTAILGSSLAGITAGVVAIKKRKKSKPKKRKARKSKKKKSRTTKRVRRSRRKRKGGIIRGRGLGRREIRHSGKSTKGKMKFVSFIANGKRVRFKTRR